MDSKQNFTDDIIFQLTVEQLAEIASAKKEIGEGIFVENRTLKTEVKIWLKER